MRVQEIPTAHTPPGGYGNEMPPPILSECTEVLPPGAPDLRGMWRTVDVISASMQLPPEHPLWRHVERIEQAGERVVIAANGIVHDMIADGTFEHGVNDVAAADLRTTIVVAATFEDGVLVLRPRDATGVEVRRWRVGDLLVWRYDRLFTVLLERVA